jgi:phage-related tail fiber protein
VSTYFAILTNAGSAKLTNAIALGQNVEWTEMAVGDGNGNPTTPNQAQTALVRERYRAQLNQLAQDPDNPNYLLAELVIPSAVGGWNVVEAGIYDSDDVLVAVMNVPATYKPILAEGSGKDLAIRMIIEVSNAANVELKIDPSIVLASRSWVVGNFLARNKVAGGTTGQVLRKTNNADEAFEWWTPGVSNITVNVVQEAQTLTTGQLIVDWAIISTSGAAFYIGGARLEPTDYVTNSATRITLARAYPAGTRILGAQNEPHDNLQPVNVIGGGGQMVYDGFSYLITDSGNFTLPDTTPLTNGVELEISWLEGAVPTLTRHGSTTLLRRDGVTDTFLLCDLQTKISLYLNKAANIWEIR